MLEATLHSHPFSPTGCSHSCGNHVIRAPALLSLLLPLENLRLLPVALAVVMGRPRWA